MNGIAYAFCATLTNYWQLLSNNTYRRRNLASIWRYYGGWFRERQKDISSYNPRNYYHAGYTDTFINWNVPRKRIVGSCLVARVSVQTRKLQKPWHWGFRRRETPRQRWGFSAREGDVRKGGERAKVQGWRHEGVALHRSHTLLKHPPFAVRSSSFSFLRVPSNPSPSSRSRSSSVLGALQIPGFSLKTLRTLPT